MLPETDQFFSFRDTEPTNNNPVILFAGDSFTTGHGLKYTYDIFSNIDPDQYSLDIKNVSS